MIYFQLRLIHNKTRGRMGIDKYKAFLSYSHSDKAWADWLHRRLETYKFPKTFPESKTAGLKPIFRDREELPVSSNLSKKIRDAIMQSECLIVICSEHSAKSKWVNTEITLFRSLKPDAEIFPVIISGEPYAEHQGLSPQKECFPKALRSASGKLDNAHSQLIEPLATDLRKNKDGKQLGLVKLIAGMVSVSPDDLIQRDLQRARKRLVAVTAGASAIVIALSLLTTSTLIARNAADRNAIFAQEQRERAETRRDEAEGLIEFMLGDLRRELEPVGRLSLLTNVADRTLEYYEHVDEDLSDCRSASGAARAKYLHTRIAVSRDDYDSARQYSDEALKLFEETASDCSELKQFVINYAHALQWSADLDSKDQNLQTENSEQSNQAILAKYQSAKTNLNQFKGDNSITIDMKIERADADILIGKFYMRANRADDALTQFKAAKAVIEGSYNSLKLTQTLKLSESYLIKDKYADILSWMSGAYEELSDLDSALSTLIQARDIYASFIEENQNTGENWQARFDIIGTDYALSRLLYKQGQKERALETLKNRKPDIDQLVSQDPSNQNWRNLRDNFTSSIASLEKTSSKLLP